jgi:hypothetical protein
MTMRPTLPAMLLLSALFAACASSPDAQTNKEISQKGALKVHPALLGERAATRAPAAVAAPVAPAAAVAEPPAASEQPAQQESR